MQHDEQHQDHGDDLLGAEDYLSGDDTQERAIPRIVGIPQPRKAAALPFGRRVPQQRDRRAE